MKVAVVFGKRRQGKSTLLRALVEASEGLYHQALAEERALALEAFGRDASDALGVAGIRPRDWTEALEVVTRFGRATTPACVVVDELPYLLKHSPELPSVLQRAIDDSRSGRRGPAVRLILCGSALSTMIGLDVGRAPLYGRIERTLRVRPFDLRTARAFWDIDDLRLAFEVDAIVGGTPAYRDVVGGPPGSTRSLGAWLARGPLDPNNLLYREPDLLLAEDLGTSDRALYASVMAAIGQGTTSPGKVAAQIERELGTVQHVIRTLVDAEMVERLDDALRARRPILRLVDPLVRFHNVVVRPNQVRLELGRWKRVWEDARTDVSTHIFGPHLESLARWWVRGCASEKTLGGVVGTVAPTVVNDSRGRTKHEIDVVALSSDRRRALLLGEAKIRRCSIRDLRDLEGKRELIKGVDVAGARLALFSATGFDNGLEDEARSRDDLELIGLDRLYGGD
jgi:hypothetical protein